MNNLKNTALLILLFITSLSAFAENYIYKADVDGMVCAFCAYSVAKNISKLPGVNADSINVDLKDGHVVFQSDNAVSEKKLTSLFNDSGFTLSNITFKKTATKGKQATAEVILDLSIDTFKLNLFTSVFEAIGNQAASNKSSLIIKAPASHEQDILKPLLMGRQQVLKVRFIANESDSMQLQVLSH